VGGLLPSSQRRAEPESSPATAALATVELTDELAEYHAQILPQRLSAPASMAVIFLVTAAVQWPAAVILLAASLLVPPNMRLAGLFAREGADARLAAGTRLGAVVSTAFMAWRAYAAEHWSAGAQTERARAGRCQAERHHHGARAASIPVRAVMDVVVIFSIAASATYTGLSLLGYMRIGAKA
jgi:ATP-binding cassette, subfamily C, bacterial CydD